jgi:hypothetical protein
VRPHIVQGAPSSPRALFNPPQLPATGFFFITMPIPMPKKAKAKRTKAPINSIIPII